MCGVHSKKDKNREKLPTNPNKKQMEEELLKEREKEIENSAELNKENGKMGHVIVSKMFMMKNPEYVKGYLNVFPNYKDQNRKGGFGCMSLNPKSLGQLFIICLDYLLLILLKIIINFLSFGNLNLMLIVIY